MDARKSPGADLEIKKGIFFEIGLALALAMVVLMFQLKTQEKGLKEFQVSSGFTVPEDMVPVTEHEKPLPKPPAVVTTPVIRVVDDYEEVDEFVRIDAEANGYTEMEEYIPPDIIEIEEEESQGTEIFRIVESMPEFPGGEEAIYRYLAENVRYPETAKAANISGRVYVTFVVEKDGLVTDVRVLRGIGGGCDEEAVRVVQGMPRWIPGKQRGKPVRVQFNLTIKFTLY